MVFQISAPLGLTLVTLLATACSSADPATPPTSLCGYDLVNTSSWVEYDEGMFTIRTPSSFWERSFGGFDTRVGAWSDGQGNGIHYSYGSVVGDLTTPPASEVIQSCEGESIGATGISRFIASWDGQHRVAAFWEDVQGASGPSPPHLLVFSTSSDTSQVATFLTVLSTVRIKTPPDPWVGEDRVAPDCHRIPEDARCR